MTTTVDSEDAATRIANALLDARAAACVQVVGPIRSHYWWQGEKRVATEWAVVAKTTVDASNAAVAAVIDAHPYEVPEVVFVPITGGHDPYLAWIASETSPHA